jgi:hypothetical protein
MPMLQKKISQEEDLQEILYWSREEQVTSLVLRMKCRQKSAEESWVLF